MTRYSEEGDLSEHWPQGGYWRLLPKNALPRPFTGRKVADTPIEQRATDKEEDRALTGDCDSTPVMTGIIPRFLE
jgi:hypothetical protein